MTKIRVDAYMYLKSPEYWLNTTNERGGGFRIGPFKSIKKALHTYPINTEYQLDKFIGWDDKEKSIVESEIKRKN